MYIADSKGIDQGQNVACEHSDAPSDEKMSLGLVRDTKPKQVLTELATSQGKDAISCASGIMRNSDILDRHKGPAEMVSVGPRSVTESSFSPNEYGRRGDTGSVHSSSVPGYVALTPMHDEYEDVGDIGSVGSTPRHGGYESVGGIGSVRSAPLHNEYDDFVIGSAKPASVHGVYEDVGDIGSVGSSSFSREIFSASNTKSSDDISSPRSVFLFTENNNDLALFLKERRRIQRTKEKERIMAGVLRELDINDHVGKVNDFDPNDQAIARKAPARLSEYNRPRRPRVNW